MPTGFILNPRNWWSSDLRLAKNNDGSYLLGDPGQGVPQSLWGLPCVITNTMPLGEFVTLDAGRAGYIADREDANVRISEHHADFFIRNMVAIRAEERVGLVIERPSAIIHGNLSHAG
jgi:HK97 family phage major capsid protein